MIEKRNSKTIFINKSLFLLKRNGSFFSDDDELILFMDGDIVIKNNILYGFIKTYINLSKPLLQVI